MYRTNQGLKLRQSPLSERRTTFRLSPSGAVASANEFALETESIDLEIKWHAHGYQSCSWCTDQRPDLSVSWHRTRSPAWDERN